MLKVIMTGNLGSDPEVRFTQDGKQLLSIRVAVNSRRRNGEEWADHTDWFRVRMMGPRADWLSQHLTKGARVFVLGRLDIGEYTTQTGEQRTSLDVWADEVELASSRSDSAGNEEPRPAQQPLAAPVRAVPSEEPEESLEDLPF